MRGFLAARCVLSLLPMLALAACGAQGLEANFESGWRAEGPASRRQEEGVDILARLTPATPPQQVPAVVGLTGRGLQGRALPDGKQWHYEGTVDVLPSLSAGLVAFSGDGSVTVLDVVSGQLVFSLPTAGRRLEGMSSDGKYLLLLLVDPDDARPDQVVIVKRNGQIIDSATELQRVGTPLALGGVGLLPWNRQYVSAFELSSGEPMGRLLVRDAIHRVSLIDGVPWVMGAGASRIDLRLLDTLGAHSLKLPLQGLPGEPIWPVDGSQPRLARGAPVAAWAHPEVTDRPRFAADTFAYAYFDLLIGLDVSSQDVKWVRFFRRAILGGASDHNGVTVCLEDGEVHAVRFKGGHSERIGSLGARLKACVVTGLPRPAKSAKVNAVPVQIQHAIRNTSPSMAAAQDFLLDDLATHEGVLTTRALLAIARDPLTSSAIARKAGEHLEKQRSGASAMLRALEEGAPVTNSLDAQADALTDGSPKADREQPATEPQSQSSPDEDELAFELPTAGLRPPPVAPLARALAALHDERAAPVLARYLKLPSIQGAPTLAVIDALNALGGTNELPAVREYFFRFKNAGGDEDSVLALRGAAAFLLRFEDERGRARVLAAQDDLLTHPAVKQALAELFKDEGLLSTSGGATQDSAASPDDAQHPDNAPPQ